jgi:hypothetical protein
MARFYYTTNIEFLPVATGSASSQSGCQNIDIDWPLYYTQFNNLIRNCMRSRGASLDLGL